MRAIWSSNFSSCGVTSVEPAATNSLNCWRRFRASGVLITAFTVFTSRRTASVDGCTQVSGARARAEIDCADVSYPRCGVDAPPTREREKKLDEERNRSRAASRYDAGRGSESMAEALVGS